MARGAKPRRLPKFKVDEYGIADEVRKQREFGKSLQETAEHINKYVIRGVGNITGESIRQWERKNAVSYEKDVLPIGVPLNTYEKVLSNHNRSVANLSNIESEITKLKYNSFPTEDDEILERLLPKSLYLRVKDSYTFNTQERLNELLSTYNSAISTEHKIATDMVSVEKTMFNTNNQKKIIDAIVNAISTADKEMKNWLTAVKKGASPENFSVKDMFYAKLREDEEVWEEIQKRY